MEQRIRRRAGLQHVAALVGDHRGGLQEHERLLRRRAVEAAPGEVIDELGVVEVGIVAAEAELESFFPLRRTVASPRVAAQAGERRHDVADEADRRRVGRVLRRDRQFDRLPFGRHLHHELTVFRGAKKSVAVDRQPLGDGISCLRRKVIRFALGRHARDEHAAGVPRAVERDRSRRDLQRRGRFGPRRGGGEKQDGELRQQRSHGLSSKFVAVNSISAPRLKARSEPGRTWRMRSRYWDRKSSPCRQIRRSRRDGHRG